MKIILKHVGKDGNRVVLAETEMFPAKYYVGYVSQYDEPVSNGTYHYFKTEAGALKELDKLLKLHP